MSCVDSFHQPLGHSSCRCLCFKLFRMQNQASPQPPESRLEYQITGSSAFLFSEGKMDALFTWTCEFVGDYVNCYTKCFLFPHLSFVMFVEKIPANHNSEEYREAFEFLSILKI